MNTPEIRVIKTARYHTVTTGEKSCHKPNITVLLVAKSTNR